MPEMTVQTKLSTEMSIKKIDGNQFLALEEDEVAKLDEEAKQVENSNFLRTFNFGIICKILDTIQNRNCLEECANVYRLAYRRSFRTIFINRRISKMADMSLV